MRRPDPREPHGTESNHISRFPKNEVSPVPEIQGKAKHGKAHVRPVIENGRNDHKVFHELKGDGSVGGPQPLEKRRPRGAFFRLSPARFAVIFR